MRNTTIEELPAVSRWEPCSLYSPDHAGSAVCADCGWLDGEHGADLHWPTHRLAS